MHFDFSVKTAASEFTLVDAEGKPVACQFTGVKQEKGGVAGAVWTVVSVPAGGSVTLGLAAGKAAGGGVRVEEKDGLVVLSNERMAVAVPRWGAKGGALTGLPAPVRGVATPGGEWLGAGQWFDEGAGAQVKQATTTIVERGPVRAVVRQALSFADGHTYATTVTLAAGQDTATIGEESDLEAPQAGWRFSLGAGLGVDRVFWQNQWAKSDFAGGVGAGQYRAEV